MFRLLQENLCNNAVDPFIAEDRKAMLLVAKLYTAMNTVSYFVTG